MPFIILGCFLDGISMVALTIGVIMPTINAAGGDPIWFGVLVVLVVEMAQITPPVGFNLFVLQGMIGKQLPYIAKVTQPLFLMMVFAVVLIYRFPGIVTGCRKECDSTAACAAEPVGSKSSGAAQALHCQGISRRSGS